MKGVVLAFSFQGQPLGTEASSVRSVAGPSQWLLGQTPWLLLHSCVRGAPSAKVSSERGVTTQAGVLSALILWDGIVPPPSRWEADGEGHTACFVMWKC